MEESLGAQWGATRVTKERGERKRNKDALPTCLDLLCITPVLVITDSDSHHNNLAIPHTVKAHAKDDQIDWICDFPHDHVCPPDLSDSDYMSFVNVATHVFLLNGLLYH